MTTNTTPRRPPKSEAAERGRCAAINDKGDDDLVAALALIHAPSLSKPQIAGFVLSIRNRSNSSRSFATGIFVTCCWLFGRKAVPAVADLR